MLACKAKCGALFCLPYWVCGIKMYKIAAMSNYFAIFASIYR